MATKKAKAAHPSIEQQLLLLRDSREREWMQQSSIRNWILETVGLSNDAEQEQLDDWKVYVFWLRLYGTVHDLLVHWKEVSKRRKERGLETKRWEELVTATEKVKAALSEEQLLYLEYRRHWVGHPILTDFRVTETTDEIRDTRRATLLDKRQTSKDAYDDVLNKMAVAQNHRADARDFARQTNPHLHRLAELVCDVYPAVILAAFVDVESA